MSTFRSSDGRKFRSEANMRKHQTAVDRTADLEAMYLGLPLERTITRLLTQARALAKHNLSLELPHGTKFTWDPSAQLPRGYIQHDPERVSALRWALVAWAALPAEGLWKRLHHIDNYGKEWDGQPGDLICYEDRR